MRTFSTSFMSRQARTTNGRRGVAISTILRPDFFNKQSWRQDELFKNAYLRISDGLHNSGAFNWRCSGKFKFALHESEAYTRGARRRSSSSNDAGRKSNATGESGACNSAPE